MKMTRIHIALGSNVGDRAATLMTALKMLDDVPGVSVRRISQLIETEPVGGPSDQGKYLNGAAEIQTTLSPQELLGRLHEIETALGRDRAKEGPSGPRPCDLDILLVGEVTQNLENLTIPHPQMHCRLFVLRPLAQIAPDVVHPVLRKTIRQLLQELETAK